MKIAIGVGGALLLLILSVGDQNIVNQVRYARKVYTLRNTYRQMERKYREDSIRLDNLINNTQDLERLARTEYQMTAPEEILFLITDSIPSVQNEQH